MRVPQIGYLADFDTPPLPEKLDAFLASGPPPVYFGFGSMTDARPGETTGTLLEAARRAGFRALISQGWAGLADGPLPSEAMSVGPVSHARLFPRVAAVVHHGGAGTTTAAARAGVPQLVVPHLVDQYYWQERVLALGLGPRAPRRRKLQVESLAAALSACRDNEVLVDRASEIGRRMREALAPEADVQTVLAPWASQLEG
jgi:vancomycin aglycone glucosyltransferase